MKVFVISGFYCTTSSSGAVNEGEVLWHVLCLISSRQKLASMKLACVAAAAFRPHFAIIALNLVQRGGVLLESSSHNKREN